jgi:hypothetical protein
LPETNRYRGVAPPHPSLALEMQLAEALREEWTSSDHHTLCFFCSETMADVDLPNRPDLILFLFLMSGCTKSILYFLAFNFSVFWMHRE